MPIIVTAETRLVVQGITGREGSFHALRNRDYGTAVVAGVTPGKGGQDVDGVPVYDTVAEAVAEQDANTAMVFVPPRFAADAIYEAVDAGCGTIICITEGIPAHDMLRVYNYIRPRGVTMLGPNCPGALSPGIANVGIIPAQVFAAGRVGLVSRSGTLTYQIGKELADLGLGNSTIVGIGGDPIVGSSFIDILERFEADPGTDLIVMVGEIGGDEEEKAGAYIDQHVSKPVVAYIAGFQAPAGKTMGHAGAIISGSSGHGRRQAAGAAGARHPGRRQPHRGRPAGGGAARLQDDTMQPMTAIPFTRGVPSADMLPVADLEAAAVTALREDGARALAYSPGGYMPLREWIGERHRVDPARVLLVNGSLQGVAFLAQHLFLGRGGVAITEDPTYDRTLISLRTFGAELVGVPVTPAGVDVDALEQTLAQRPARMLYLIPTFQNPSGVSLPEEGRRRVVELARRHEVLVVEDDPYGLLRFEGRAGADAARAGRRRQRRLLLLVHQDGGARHPHRLPGAARADGGGDGASVGEHPDRAQHVRRGGAGRVLPGRQVRAQRRTGHGHAQAAAGRDGGGAA